ncbi:FIST signal transduction protein [Flavobacterium undicola]|uniref:FIST signal transduction protein n=1 Tax=Flavobacterium undicola TaxID=1932779 RepID=UPI0013776AF7|nr:FIST N-terminal domain-containing protein [Flavobacterium undicola]MBA0884241.1 FIST C-terminal domain-containing protein [Flavobacterium undicola]
MKLQQIIINDKKEGKVLFSSDGFDSNKANLVLAFGERVLLDDILPYKKIKELYPEADIVICSTSGQISNTSLVENSIVATAINFEKTAIKVSEIDILNNFNIEELGEMIKKDLFKEDLKSILILSEGSFVNGTELINELIKQTKGKIPIFGGLAGDEYKFEKTIVGLNSDASQGKVVAVGFYGDAIHFGFGSEGGWSDFGPEREVTLSEKNVLYKIGDRFALDLYKEYLGKYAEELPSSSLYFPLSMKENIKATPVVRTILSIDEGKKSMTFAGNIPQGSFVRLMKGNLDKLIDASYNAALQTFSEQSTKPKLALLVSCVGRKIVLGNRIEEELEVVKEVFGEDTLVCGFYSYGEISPTLKKVACELHNQTMTIATIYEE